MSREKSFIKKKIGLIVVFSFFLNLLWEVAHSLLYDYDRAPLVNDIFVYIPEILLATLNDAFWVYTFILWVCLGRRGFQWLRRPSRTDYIAITVIGFVYAVLIEIVALQFNFWSYNEYMPVVFGIGLTPLVQLSATTLLSLHAANRLWVAPG